MSKKEKRPTPVKRSSLSVLLMGDGEGKPDIVIDDDMVKEYVGIGWIDLRVPTSDDFMNYPVVID